MPARHLSKVLFPLPLRPTIPKNSPGATSRLTSQTASSTSKVRDRNACRARSLSVWYCSWGRRNDLLRLLTEIAGGSVPVAESGRAERSVLAITLMCGDGINPLFRREPGRSGLYGGLRGPVLACATLNVCTIIAKNYLAHARVLARSLKASAPEAKLWTLIIDDFERYIDPEREPFEVLTPSDVGCEQFTRMALRYSVLELSTAVKPWLLRHLMAQTGGPVTYLDPDIKVFAPLRRLDELAERHGLVLTPHNSEPIPADGRRPGQIDIMIAGVSNLGFVSLAPRPEIESLLDWWADRLLRDCRVDPIWGYFVDQRWFDLAPGFLSDLAIVRDPEYNVAYWNLHERRLTQDDGRYLVNGRPLAFFHFSGFDPDHPVSLSRHQNRTD